MHRFRKCLTFVKHFHSCKLRAGQINKNIGGIYIGFLKLSDAEREWTVRSESAGIDYLVGLGTPAEKLWHVINHEDEKRWTKYQTILNKKINTAGADVIYRPFLTDVYIDVKTPKSSWYRSFYFELHNGGKLWTKDEKFINELTFGDFKQTDRFLFMFKSQPPRLVRTEDVLQILKFHSIQKVRNAPKSKDNNEIWFLENPQGDDPKRIDLIISERQLLHYLNLPIVAKYDDIS